MKLSKLYASLCCLLLKMLQQWNALKIVSMKDAQHCTVGSDEVTSDTCTCIDFSQIGWVTEQTVDV